MLQSHVCNCLCDLFTCQKCVKYYPPLITATEANNTQHDWLNAKRRRVWRSYPRDEVQLGSTTIKSCSSHELCTQDAIAKMAVDKHSSERDMRIIAKCLQESVKMKVLRKGSCLISHRIWLVVLEAGQVNTLGIQRKFSKGLRSFI